MLLKSRRNFLKSSFFATTLVIMSKNKIFASLTPLETLSLVQQDLFPFANTLEANSTAYISLIFHHTLVNDEDKEFLRNETTAQPKSHQSYFYILIFKNIIINFNQKSIFTLNSN